MFVRPDFLTTCRSFLFGGAVSLVAALPTPSAADAGYSFGVVPQFEARKLSEIWTPILAEIESRVGHELHMVGSPRIPDFEQSFANGEFDFAYMNPYHSLVAFEAEGYEPLIRDGARQLFGVLVVHKDSPYQSVADLDGKRVAFPAPNALGASLLMRAELDRIHNISVKPRYVATHSSAYLNVALGEAEAAGGVMGTFRSLDPEIQDQLRIIYETRKLPPHPITVHPRVPREVAEAVQQAFLDLAMTPEGQELLKQVPLLEAVPAQVSDYEILKEMRLEDFYIETVTN